MADSTTTLRMLLLGDDQSASTALRQLARELDQTASDGEQAGRRISDSSENVRRGVEQGIGIGVAQVLAEAGEAAAEFVASSVESFSQLEDSTAAASVVFGSSMGQIIDQSREAATSLGMSQAQVIDASNTFGTFGKAAGLAGDDLASFSTRMTALAGDMASFRGTSPEQAIEAIGAAMRGEMEPIRAYGVLLDDATLRQEALKMGLIKTTSEALDPQTKVLAAEKAILEQTTMAQGDFARTADSSANTQKTFSAEVENTKAALGAGFAPVIRDVERGLLGFLKAAQDNASVLPGLITLLGGVAAAMTGIVAVQKTKDAIEGIGSAVEAASGKLASWGEALSKMDSKPMQGLGAAVTGLSSAVGPLALALAAGAAAYLYFAQQAEEVRQRTEEVTRAIEADSGVIGENTNKLMANKMAKDGTIDAAHALGIADADLIAAHEGQADALARVNAVLEKNSGDFATNAVASGLAGTSIETNLDPNVKKVRDSTALWSAATAEATRQNTLVAGATQAAGAASASAKPSTEDFAKSVDEVAKSAKKEYDELQKATKGIWDHLNAVLAESGSNIAYKASIDSATEAIAKNGQTLDINTKAGRDNRTALDQMVRTGEQVIKTMIDSGKPIADVNKELQAQHDAFVKAAEGATGSKKKAEELWATYKLNPGTVTTLIQEHGQAETKQKIIDLTAQIRNVPESHRTEFQAALNSGDVAHAEAVLNQVARERTATVTVRVDSLANGSWNDYRSVHSRLMEADGGIVRYYGDGGIESHVAQIAPAGAMRVWAEPETGGEAYIPLSPSKRERSVDIWRQTGSLLGVQGFADGAILGGGSSSGVGVQVIVHGSVVQEHDLAMSVRDAMAQAIRRRGGDTSVLGV